MLFCMNRNKSIVILLKNRHKYKDEFLPMDRKWHKYRQPGIFTAER